MMGIGTTANKQNTKKIARRELAGQVLGYLTVLEYVGNRYWLVRCECGTEKRVMGSALQNGMTLSCGCKTLELRMKKLKDPRGAYSTNITDFRFGKLVVLGRGEGENSRSTWLVKCDCGVQKVIKRSRLNHGLASCGCGKSHPLEPTEAPRRRTLARYKLQAKKRDLVWELTDQEATALFAGSCFYCGTPPQGCQRGAVGEFMYNGIDRMNSEIGYTTDNTVSCCGLCNRSKSNIPFDDYVAHIRQIAQHWASHIKGSIHVS